MTIKSERHPLTVALPHEVVPIAMRMLNRLSEAVKSHEHLAQQCKGTPGESFFNEGLKICADAHATLEKLFADETIMLPIWKEIAQHYPDKISVLPEQISAAYDDWYLRKPVDLPNQRKKQLQKLAKKMRELALIIADAPDLKHLLDTTLFTCIAHEMAVQHSDTPGLQPEKEYAIQNRIHPPEDALLKTPYIDAYAVINNMAQAMAAPLDRLTKHDPGSAFPRKLNEKSAERTYFIKVVAAAVKEIYGQKRHATVAAILSVIREDCMDITESNISKNA